MPKSQKITISEFYCTQCGNKGFDLPRKIGKQREPGHLKKLYCIHCKKENNFAEVRGFGEYSKQDFDLEYEFGNFTEDGERKIPYKQFEKQKIEEGVVIYE